MTIPWIRLGSFVLAALAMLLTDARPGHAQAADQSEREADRNELPAAGHEKVTPRRSWELPALGGNGRRREEDLVGDNLQPRWTAHDGFGLLDVYVLPKGTGALAYELRLSRSRESGRTGFTSEYQAEFGLPARIQLGLHAVGTETGSGGVLGNVHAQTVAVRWAVSDWGSAWGNPAIEVKWKEASRDADAATVALLAGGHLADGWHWASNVSWRRDVGASEASERAWTTGVTYAVKDSVVALGLETRIAAVRLPAQSDVTPTGTVTEMLVGPSVQLRPSPWLHVALTPLVGVTQQSPSARAVIQAGIEF